MRFEVVSDSDQSFVVNYTRLQSLLVIVLKS